MASMITIAVYFKFSRLWSIRNFDLVGLLLYAPALLLIAKDGTPAILGYAWLFLVSAGFLVRMLCDPMLVRRPLLEANLSPGGLVFMGASLLVFLFTNVITAEITDSDLRGARRLDQMLSRVATPADQTDLVEHGPGYPLLHIIGSMPSKALVEIDQAVPEDQRRAVIHTSTTRTMAILSHLAIVFGMVLMGSLHFHNVRTGVSAAALYLLLPYTAHMVGRVDHVLPAALLVWAAVAYRRPLIAGLLMGLAAGAIYYPIFLLPLWISFYWQRGLTRFTLGFAVTLSLLIASLALTSIDFAAFLAQARQMLGWTSLLPEAADGFWSGGRTDLRLPVFAAFLAIAGSLAMWPTQKNLGTLLSCSAAIMLGTQFWQAHHGGLFIAWYLPLLLLAVFRPNLEDRVALSVLSDGWSPRSRAQRNTVIRAA
ncbi:MAG: hypothetical protein K1X74_00825 [Pirellulales bacterium]|nr:hypothetical protein [Pirellulales bacterium]